MIILVSPFLEGGVLVILDMGTGDSQAGLPTVRSGGGGQGDLTELEPVDIGRESTLYHPTCKWLGRRQISRGSW